MAHRSISVANRLMFVHQHPDAEHAGVVIGKQLLCGTGGNETEVARNRGLIVDPLAAGIVLSEKRRLVPCNQERESAVRQSPFRDSCIIKASEVVPVPRPALASPPSLKTVNVNSRGLLPERTLRQHDGWPRLRKHKIRKVRSGIAHDRAGQMGLARGACSEVDLHLWTHGPERLEQRIVANVEALGLRTNPCLETGACKLLS